MRIFYSLAYQSIKWKGGRTITSRLSGVIVAAQVLHLNCKILKVQYQEQISNMKHNKMHRTEFYKIPSNTSA